MQKRRTLGDLGQRLTACHPKTQLLRDQGQIDKLHSRLAAAMEKQTSERRQNLLSLTGSDDERLVRAVHSGCLPPNGSSLWAKSESWKRCPPQSFDPWFCRGAMRKAVCFVILRQ